MSYHQVCEAAEDVLGSAASGSIGFLLIPMAKDVLTAWPEYKYATGKRS